MPKTLDQSLLMKKVILTSLFFLILSLFFPVFLSVAGAEQTYFAYIIPSNTEIQINGETEVNSQAESLVRFKEAPEETIHVDAETKGLRVISNHYSLDVNSETTLLLNTVLTLKEGSIHVKSEEIVGDPQVITLGDLMIRFQGGEFLAFMSDDQSQSIVKVIEGRIEVENPKSEQTATLEALQATSTDKEGRLLIPFPIERDQNGWWNQDSYLQDYEKPPIADAGADQRVLLNMAVTLNGSLSEFSTGDIFEWKLIQAPPDAEGKPIEKVAFNTINIVKPLFTPKVSGEYQFSLQITDEKGVKSNISDVTIYVGKEFLKPVDIFSDVPAIHPNNLAITYFYKKNVMTGSGDPETGEKVFRPEERINRVEILKTVFANLQETIPTKEEIEALPEEQRFADVKADHWFAPFVYFAKGKGIVKGNGGFYRPADEVLLGEAMKIIVEASKISIDAYKGLKELPYADTESEAWYNPYLFFVKKYELFDADSVGNINPGKPLTRAEFAEILFRLESRNLQEKKGFVMGTIFDKQTKKGVAYAEVFVYETLQSTGEGESSDGFVRKGDLYKKVAANEKGYFTITLPIHTKYYLEAVTEEDISANKLIVQVEEDEVKSVELHIETE